MCGQGTTLKGKLTHQNLGYDIKPVCVLESMFPSLGEGLWI